ncbi:MAG: hypothetical protein ABWY05_12030 [Noviherbaspirillum sp.]
MKRTPIQARHGAPSASSSTASTAGTAGARNAQANPADHSRTAHEKPALYSKPTSSAGQHAVAEFRPGGERREQYIERGQQPSFEFASIDDKQVLKVEAALRMAIQNVPAARPAQTEETRRLSGIAAAIQKMMEGEVASVLRKLAQIPAEGPAQSTAQDAKNSYSLFIQQFQQAKLAAAIGNRGDMNDALALDELAGLAGRHGEKSARQARSPRIFSGATLACLHTIAEACSAWAGADNPMSLPGSATVRVEPEGAASEAADARMRSLSSPVQVKKSQERERARSASGHIPSHKKPSLGASAERQARQEESAAPKSPTSPGKKLKSLFSRSSEGRTRAPGDGEPVSPRSRASLKLSAGAGAAATTAPRLSSPPRPQKKRSSDD